MIYLLKVKMIDIFAKQYNLEMECELGKRLSGTLAKCYVSSITLIILFLNKY